MTKSERSIKGSDMHIFDRMHLFSLKAFPKDLEGVFLKACQRSTSSGPHPPLLSLCNRKSCQPVV